MNGRPTPDSFVAVAVCWKWSVGRVFCPTFFAVGHEWPIYTGFICRRGGLLEMERRSGIYARRFLLSAMNGRPASDSFVAVAVCWKWSVGRAFMPDIFAVGHEWQTYTGFICRRGGLMEMERRSGICPTFFAVGHEWPTCIGFICRRGGLLEMERRPGIYARRLLFNLRPFQP